MTVLKLLHLIETRNDNNRNKVLVNKKTWMVIAQAIVSDVNKVWLPNVSPTNGSLGGWNGKKQGC